MHDSFYYLIISLVSIDFLINCHICLTLFSRDLIIGLRGLTWDDRDGIPAASLPAKFCMPDIEHNSGIGYPKIPLRLYSTVMRAHRIDDAQLVALFPMSLSGAA